MTNNTLNTHISKLLIIFTTLTIFAGLSMASVTGITGDADNTDNIEIGENSITQTVTFDTTIDGVSSLENYTLDVSSATGISDSVTLPGGSGNVTISGTNSGEVTLNNINDKISGENAVELNITDDSTGSSHAFTIEVTLTHDTSSVSSENTGNSYTLTEDGGDSTSGTVTYDYVDTNAPSAPSGVSATAVSGGDIEVSFDDVDESGSGVTSYSVKRSTTTGGSYSEEGTVNDDNTGPYTFTDTTASDGTTYYYVVTAIDDAGNEGSQSSEVSATSDSTSPTVDSASITNSPITDSEAGNQQTVTVEFSETMDTTVDPTVEITGIDGGPVSVSQSSYTDSTYEGTVTIDDKNEDTTATIKVSGADDEAGNTMSSTDSSNTFNVDTENPSVSTSFDGSQALSETVDITSYFDPSTGDGESTTYEYDDGNGFSTISSSSNWDSTSASDGDVTFRATTTDDNGNEDTASGSATVDNTDPSSVSVDNTPVNTQSGQSVDIEVSFSEINPESVDVTIDGTTQTFNSVSDGSNTLTVDAENVPTTEGTYDIGVTVTDSAGNTGSTTNQDDLNVDDTPSSLDSASRVDDTTIEATLSDDRSGLDSSTISSGDFSLDPSPGFSIDTSSISDRETSGTVTINLDSGVDSDTVTVSLQNDGIDDLAANTQTSGSADATGMDSAPPSISNPTIDTEGPVTSDDSVLVSAEVTDGEAVDSVSTDASGLGAGTVELTEAETDNYTATFTVGSESSVSSDGDKSLTIEANDTSSNENTAGTGSITVDTTPPTVESYSVINPSGQDVFVTFNSTEQLSTISAGVSGAEESTLTGGDFSENAVDGKYNYTATYSGSSDGEYTVTLETAEDTAGNDASSESDSTTVDTTSPSVTLVTVTDKEDDLVRNDEDVVISAKVTDTNSIQNVEADTGGLGAGTVSLTQHDSTDTYNTTVSSDDTTVDSEETATVSITATDNFDNSNDTETGSIEIDGIAPTINTFEVTNSVDQAATVTIESDEELEAITVSGTDDSSGQSLELQDFDETENSGFTYEANISSGSDGIFGADLDLAEDAAGNDGSSGDSDSVTVDTEAPTIENPDPSGDTVTDSQQIYTVDITDATSGVDEGSIFATVSDSSGNLFTDTGTSDDRVNYSSNTLTVGGSEYQDGQVTVTVNVDDNQANSASEFSSSFTVDTTGPEITSPEVLITSDQNSNGVLNEGDEFKVEADVSDEFSTVDSVEADLSGLNPEVTESPGSALLSNPESDVWNETFTVGSASEIDSNGLSGETNLSVELTATDSETNENSNSDASVAVDTTDPSVSIDTDERVSGGISLEWSSTSGDVASYNLYRKEESSEYNSLDENTATSYEDTDVENGTDYTYRVEVLDDGGNKVNATSSIVTADTEPPILTNVEVKQDGGDDIVTTGDTVSVSAEVADSPEGVKNVTVDASALTDIQDANELELTKTDGTYSTAFDVSNPSEDDGDVSLTLTTYDNLDQENTDSDSVTLDTVVPTVEDVRISDNTDSNGVVAEGDEILVKINASDDTSGIDTVSVENSDFNGGSVTVTELGDDADNDYSATFTAGTGDTDSATVSVSATDIATNGGSQNVESENSLTIDNSGPSISSASTNDLDTDGDVDQINVTLSEAIDDSESTLNSSTFSLGTSDLGLRAVDSVDTGEASDDDSLVLDVSGFDTGFAPDVTLAVGLESVDVVDDAGNTKSSNQTFEGTSDEANPVLMSAEIDHRDSTDSNTRVNLVFSESVSDDDEDSDGVWIDGRAFDLGGETSTIQISYGDALQTGDSPLVNLSDEVTDGSNPAVNLSGENVEVDTFRKDIVEGWNFVSFPVADSSTYQVDEVLDDSKVDVVWKYEDGEWKSSNTDFDTVEGGIGYLVNADESFTLAPNVNNIREEVGEKQEPTQSVDLNNGWNLVGQFQEFDQQADTSEAFGSLNSQDLGAVEEQASPGSLGLTRITDMSGSSSETMNTGSAYWMWAKDSTSFTWN